MNVDHGQVVGRGLILTAVILSLHQVITSDGWPSKWCHIGRLKWFTHVLSHTTVASAGREMSLPRMAVKPHSNTQPCNWSRLRCSFVIIAGTRRSHSLVFGSQPTAEHDNQATMRVLARSLPCATWPTAGDALEVQRAVSGPERSSR